MDVEMLNQAKERIPNIPLLINAVSKRVRQLNAGARPLFRADPRMSNMDVAITELAEGKLTVEMVHHQGSESDRGESLIQL